MIFHCPICKQPMQQDGNRCFCSKGHSYDRAAEGYFHLLPSNKMHSKHPGDSKQMVRSRRDFLEQNHYQLFSDTLNQLIVKYLSDHSNQGHPAVLLDAGCGEGYYTGRMAQALGAAELAPEIAGFDISKFAVKAAAKRYPNIEFAVASIFAIPVADQAVDCLVNVFAPIVEEEFARVVRPGGVMLLVVPGERHLFGLKEILYENPYENEHRKTEYSGFSFVERIPVSGKLLLESPKTIQDLFAMTPYYWKTPVEGSRRLQETTRLETEIQFDFLVYRRDFAGK
ncbi:MAG: methyltransferase domain-containing protein [Clostridiales bacterium]|jgi:23S rRNA (guanine745-N1)-methyltransferase|nr:methyltransferase domain-containing protein [Clostridiales bacterium]